MPILFVGGASAVVRGRIVAANLSASRLQRIFERSRRSDIRRSANGRNGQGGAAKRTRRRVKRADDPSDGRGDNNASDHFFGTYYLSRVTTIRTMF